MTPTITAFAWVPPFARGFVRDIRARWAFEEAQQDYAVDLVDGVTVKSEAHRYFQPFGQVRSPPTAMTRPRSSSPARSCCTSARGRVCSCRPIRQTASARRNG